MVSKEFDSWWGSRRIDLNSEGGRGGLEEGGW